MAHVFDNGMRSTYPEIFFPAPRGTGSADVLIEPHAAADDGRIAQPSGDLECRTARSRHRGHLAFRVERQTIDGAVGRRIDSHSPRPLQRFLIRTRKRAFEFGDLL